MNNFDMVMRVVNIVLGVLACVVVLLAVRRTHVGKAEAVGMTGGALTCFAVAFGSAGFLFMWPTEIWLPFMALSLLYVIGGRCVQMWNLRKKS